MNRATWRVLAFGALMAAVALPASAQLVIGGSGQPNVVVNWSVLDSLGQQPNLPEMLRQDVPLSQARAALNQPAPAKGVQYHAYKPGADTTPRAEKPARKVSVEKPKRPVATPVVAKAEAPRVSPAVAQLVQAAKAEPPKKAEIPAIELPKVAPPKPPVIAAVPEPVKVAPPAPKQAPPEPVKLAAMEAPKPLAVAPAPMVKAAPPPPPAPKPELAAAPMALTPAPLPPAPKPEPVAAPQQLASLAPPAPVAAPAVTRKGDTLSVAFASDSASLSASVHPELDKLVRRLQKDENLGLQLLAYAEGDEAGASKARRLSLSRALEVRKYLLEQGVRSTRIEVRALGNKQEGHGPADRVDALVVNR